MEVQVSYDKLINALHLMDIIEGKVKNLNRMISEMGTQDNIIIPYVQFHKCIVNQAVPQYYETGQDNSPFSKYNTKSPSPMFSTEEKREVMEPEQLLSRNISKKTAIEAFKKLDEFIKPEDNDNNQINKKCNSNLASPNHQEIDFSKFW